MDRESLARRVTVAVVEDHPLTLLGIRTALEEPNSVGAVVVASGPSPEAVLAGPGGEADVVVLDLQLKDRLLTAEEVAQLCVGHRVVIFSGIRDTDTIRAMSDAGAVDYVVKEEGPEHLLETVLAAAADRTYTTPTTAGAIVADAPTRARLSAREEEVLLKWFQGMSKDAVARSLGISYAAVCKAIERARAKYIAQGREVSTQFAILARAIEDGLITPEEVQGFGLGGSRR